MLDSTAHIPTPPPVRALTTANVTGDCLPDSFTDELSSYLTSLAPVSSSSRSGFRPRLL